MYGLIVTYDEKRKEKNGDNEEGKEIDKVGVEAKGVRKVRNKWRRADNCT
jgi:hypothetical protein